jgi:valyl-tRNA synthetase
MMNNFDKTYKPEEFEKRWIEEWESRSLYRVSHKNKDFNESFSIQLPPPNVTGTLHMGHAFNQTLMDILVRWHRMMGKKTVWIPGTDHAGIATQLVVENKLKREGKNKENLGRAKFLEEVWSWKKSSGDTITNQMRRLGSSCDWESAYFTMDKTRSDFVRKVFVELYHRGLIYRGTRLVNWDPVLMTAISDLEVVTEETEGFLWEIKYPIGTKKNDRELNLTSHIAVATTRPETLFGDVAIAVNPDDERFIDLVGKYAVVPLVDRVIPIIADNTVDKDFGTGCVKITPAHDFNDYEVGKRHNLTVINVLTKDGKINDKAPKEFLGKDRFVARKLIIEKLDSLNLLKDTKKHKLALKKGDRSDAVIEPMLTIQWFIDVNKPSPKGTPSEGKSLVQQGLNSLENGDFKFVPDNWKNTYKIWLNDLQDWCISRQLWWGHQIPAWYKTNNDGQIIDHDNVFVAVTKNQAQAMASQDGWEGELTQDKDVLDTWFSSSLVPFSTLLNESDFWDNESNAPKLSKDLKDFLPSSVLVTGFDIIFFWVARMVMMTNHFMGKSPFKDVYIHALVRDGDGNKMSKSKGNTLDPLDIIDGISLEDLLVKRTSRLISESYEDLVRRKTEKEFPKGISPHGVDALRFTFASMASPGRNINFNLSRCEGYRNFCNKLWNANRFILMQCEGNDNGMDTCGGDCGIDGPLFFTKFDRWIVSIQQQVIKDVSVSLTNYRFDLAAKTLYEFFWNDFCDWYLEICKTQLAEDKENLRKATRRNMIRVFEITLRLLHPFIPFITEEVWQTIGKISLRSKDLAEGKKDSIMIASFPKDNLDKVDEKAVEYIETVKQIVSSIRSLRSTMKLSPSERPEAVFIIEAGKNIYNSSGSNIALTTFEEELALKVVKQLGKIKSIDVLNKTSKELNEVPFELCGDIKIYLVVKIDKEREKERLKKEIEKTRIELEKIETKLNNKAFIQKAPEKIVFEQREKGDVFNAKIMKLQERLDSLG